MKYLFFIAYGTGQGRAEEFSRDDPRARPNMREPAMELSSNIFNAFKNRVIKELGSSSAIDNFLLMNDIDPHTAVFHDSSIGILPGTQGPEVTIEAAGSSRVFVIAYSDVYGTNIKYEQSVCRQELEAYLESCVESESKAIILILDGTPYGTQLSTQETIENVVNTIKVNQVDPTFLYKDITDFRREIYSIADYLFDNINRELSLGSDCSDSPRTSPRFFC